eukprot:scaffold6706_cov119-Isochrysis_galbana.AAC.5
MLRACRAAGSQHASAPRSWHASQPTSMGVVVLKRPALLEAASALAAAHRQESSVVHQRLDHD